MNQAILIMMHKNPEQVVRLVKYFPDDRCVCFIHVDKKCRLSLEKFQEALDAVNKKCIILEKRISGQLANWSLAEISLELIKMAYRYSLEKGMVFSYYRLLSGQDYPLRTFQEYESFLEKNYPKEFMGINHYEEGIKHIQDKFNRWRFNRERNILSQFIKNSILYKMCLAPFYLIEILWTKIKGTPYERMCREGYITAGGPSWWNISNRLVGYIVEEVEKKSPVIDIVKYTATPEESIIQVLYANAPWYKRESTYNLTIGNYGRRGEKMTGHTYVWGRENIQELLDSKCFFARKFDEDVDSEVLEQLDEKIYPQKEYGGIK